MYTIPQARAGYTSETAQFKATTNVAPGMKLSLMDMTSKERGVNREYCCSFVSDIWTGNIPYYSWQSGSNGTSDLSLFDEHFEWFAYSNANFKLVDIDHILLGGEFTHAFRPNSFYEIQDQLVHAEKMASIGQLTAGIAHEIKNPLNFVNNFSRLSLGMMEEIDAWIEEHAGGEDEEIRETLTLLKMNAEKIAHHGERADGIVRAMLEHSRTGPGERRPVELNRLLEEYVNLAYHGWHGARSDTIHRVHIELIKIYDEAVGEVELSPQEMGRVFMNLLSNAFDAVQEKAAQTGDVYVPQVRVKTTRNGDGVEVQVEDNGLGVPRQARDRVFEPFYTTKPTGSGTGLGLSLSHDIVVKGHGGQLMVESEEGEGARFVIRLPNAE